MLYSRIHRHLLQTLICTKVTRTLNTSKLKSLNVTEIFKIYGRSSKFCSFKFSHFICYQAEGHSFLHRNKVFYPRLCFWIFVVINIRNDLVNMYFNVYLRYNRQDNITIVFLKCFLLIFIVFINNNCQDDQAICWQANTQEPHYTWMEFSFKYGSILKFYCSQIFRNWKIKKVCENMVGFKILR